MSQNSSEKSPLAVAAMNWERISSSPGRLREKRSISSAHFEAARNLWKMTRRSGDATSHRDRAPDHRPGLDTELALSADGKRLAFTVESKQFRVWLFPFDATRGRVTGAGQAVTSPGMEAGSRA